MIAKYESYLCYGSTIRWNIQPVGIVALAAPTDADAYQMVLYPLNSGASPVATNVTDAKVQKYSKYHLFPPNGPVSPVPSGVGSRFNEWIGRHSMTVAKLDGESDLRTSFYEANFNADPTRVCFWEFQFQDLLADVTSRRKFLFEIEIDYDVLFFRRLTQANALRGPGLPRERAPDYTERGRTLDRKEIEYPEEKKELKIMELPHVSAPPPGRFSPGLPLDIRPAPLVRSDYVLVKRPC